MSSVIDNIKNIVADSGYESEVGYVFLEKENYIAYIKPQTYEKWKKKALKMISARGRTCSMMQITMNISAIIKND